MGASANAFRRRSSSYLLSFWVRSALVGMMSRWYRSNSSPIVNITFGLLCVPGVPTPVWPRQGQSKAVFLAITKRINGGTNGLADREALYARALEVLQ